MALAAVAWSVVLAQALVHLCAARGWRLRTAAILVTAPIMLFWLLNGGALLAQVLGRRGTPGAYFALGWIGLVVAQLLGSLVARAGRWAMKR